MRHPMPYFHHDLAILGAEHFVDGQIMERPASPPKKGRKARHSPTQTLTGRKRGRKASEAEVDADERETETKRARGRPRLDSKDQTPSERRRTQIRLAQRAYRDRKESAITELETKVSGLVEGHKEMRTAYQRLLDLAASSGVLAQAPEFGQQLQQFRALLDERTREASESGSGEISTERDSDEPRAKQQQKSRKSGSANDTSRRGNTPSSPKSGESQQQQLLGGLIVSHAPMPGPEQRVPQPTVNPGSMMLGNHPVQYEIVAAPTSRNASFAPTASFDTSFLDSSPHAWPELHPSPWDSLPAPRSFAFNEWSFGRRLHRTTLESAVALLCNPDPPPAALNRVFGFVRLFETVEQIRTRSLDCLSRLREEPLSHWRHPFHHLGGIGTHYHHPRDEQQSQSQSASDSASFPYPPDQPPYESSGFGLGPFDERTSRVRDSLLGISQFVNMEGWEGTFFDPYEAETYLAQNGIVIPAAAELHTVVIQPGDFFLQQQQKGSPSLAGRQTSSSQNAIFAGPEATRDAASATSGAIPGPMATTMAPSSSGLYPPPTSDMDSNTLALSSLTSSSAPPWSHIISRSGAFFGGSGVVDDNHGAMTSGNLFDNNPPLASDFSVSPYLQQHPATAGTTTNYNMRRVTLNVNRFINAMIGKATCLGRSPAYRPKDVVSAFWEAAVGE